LQIATRRLSNRRRQSALRHSHEIKDSKRYRCMGSLRCCWRSGVNHGAVYLLTTRSPWATIHAFSHSEIIKGNAL
jgi:hypothetical protein